MAAEKPSLEGLRIDRSERVEGGGRGRLWIALAIVAVLAPAVWGGLARPRAAEGQAATAQTPTRGPAAARARLHAPGHLPAPPPAPGSSENTRQGGGGPGGGG